MKKKTYLILLLFVITTLAGCSGFTQKENHVGEKAGEAKKESVAKTENTVVWAVREDARIPKRNIQKTNQLLVKKGYDIAIKVKKLEVDRNYEKQEIYHDALEKAVKEKVVDVAYVDACYDTALGEMAQYLQSGLFYTLNKWLHSTEGKAVYKLYDKEVWKGSSVSGKNYVFPNEIYYDVPQAVIAFRKDHVSQKLVKSWDGSWSDMLRIMDKIKLGKDDMMVAGYPQTDYFEGWIKKRKYMIDDDIVYNIQDQTVHQPFELEEFYKYLSFLHECYQKGYVTHGMDNGITTQDEVRHQERGEYAIAWQVDRRINPSDHFLVRNPVCVRGILGKAQQYPPIRIRRKKHWSL